jgi:hypothetical protein
LDAIKADEMRYTSHYENKNFSLPHTGSNPGSGWHAGAAGQTRWGAGTKVVSKTVCK